MEKESRLNWDNFITAAELSERLLATLENSGITTPEGVRQFSIKEGMEVSELIDKTIYASHPILSGHPLVEVKWLISYGFTPLKPRLISIAVTKGPTAP